MFCRLVLMTGVAGDVWIDSYDLIGDMIRSITKSNFAAMGIAVCIMTGLTDDCLAGCHIVSVGPDRFSVMTGQDIVHRCGMTRCTGSVRRGS